MKYPKLRAKAHDKQYIDTFGGYNHNPRIGDGEFYDVANMSADEYPLLKVRKPHGVYNEGKFYGMISKDELCYVAAGDLVIGNKRVQLGLSSGQKTLVSMGAYVIIFPDKMYVNTADPELTDYGYIAAQCGGTGATVSNCTQDGTQIPSNHITISETQPEDGINGYYWINTSTAPATMFRYSGESGQWFDVKSYIRISSEHITDDFSAGDSVQVGGFIKDGYDLDGYYSIAAAGIDQSVIGGVQKRFIAVPGIVAEISVAFDTEFTISRDAPDMDFVIEANNRLWGCKYGYVDGKLVNEIYASKLGDFKNWRNYAGISTDSYAASVGTDGPFTGAVNYGGYPMFFKERCVHKVYGSMPSSFQIQTDMLYGVQEGCGQSLAIVNEVLYYKSRTGICAYDGSFPSLVSENLGNETYNQAIAGAFRSKYYVAMKQYGIQYGFVYDTSKRIWHKWQIPEVVTQFCAHGDELYFITSPAFADSFIGTVYGSGTESDFSEKKVYWSAESGMLGLNTPDKKTLVSLDLRMLVELGSKVKLFIQYDSNGHWHPFSSIVGKGIQVVNIPIIPRRCDHFRIKIEGEGPATLFSICKTIEEGTEL